MVLNGVPRALVDGVDGSPKTVIKSLGCSHMISERRWRSLSRARGPAIFALLLTIGKCAFI